jgi:diketogulonate reductase-like aldo/keto reductase
MYLDHARLRPIVARVGRSAAQVMLRWGVEKGMVVLPKSTHEARIRENGALFDFSLDAEATAALDALEEGVATGWDPRRQP